MKKLLLSLLLILSMGIITAQPTVALVPFATGFSEGLCDIQNAGDSRLFIVEKLGYISIVDSMGNVLPGYFLNIHNKVTPTTFSPGNEQGLLGLAFSPNYDTDGYFYVNYTDKTGGGNTVIARYQVSAANPDSASPFSEEILMHIYQPYSNHNGGGLAFGDDGFLYIALGDGGSGGDPGNRAQNTDSLLGKILRIDVSTIPGYSIPPSNPFAVSGGAPEIWAYGVRNPFKISFDRTNGNLWIGDVGQNMYEEIDMQPSGSAGGLNYGWRCYEGNHAFNTTGCGPMASYEAPVYEYSHSATGGCSIIGGYVYRGADTLLNGYYFYTDYCNAVMSILDSNFNASTAGTFAGNNFTTFGENNTGELFVGSQNNGTVYRIVSNPTGIEVYNELINSLNVFPNPGYGLFTCEINVSEKSDADLVITDIAGKACYNEKITLQPGHNNFEIDLEGFSSGSYQMKISVDDAVVYKKLEIIK